MSEGGWLSDLIDLLTLRNHKFVCPSCGKPVHPWEDACPFCDTPLSWGDLKRSEPDLFFRIFERNTSYERWRVKKEK
jgi:predicted amidophosphoribosyltransferase